MDRKSEFERSNAFADGELDRESRSEVLAAASRDQRLAKELSDLTKLKSAVEDCIEVPEINLALKTRGGPSLRMGLAVAASLALAVLAGVGWWLIAATAPSIGVPIAWAMEAHRSWVDGGSEAAVHPPFWPAGTRLDAHVPDLSAAKLRVAHVGELVAPGGGRALMVGYLGTRGCRVTLLMERTKSDLGAAATYMESEGVLAMAWQAGPLRHLIIAQGMDRSRFRVIAEAVHRASQERLPIDEPTRTALARSRAASPPCAA